jgi:hypothetical protein
LERNFTHTHRMIPHVIRHGENLQSTITRTIALTCSIICA